MCLEIPSRLLFIDAIRFPLIENRVASFLDKAFLYPINLPHADIEDTGNLLFR
jgi:hypothetical protein